MKNVLITEKKTGRFVAMYPIVIHGMNYTPSENEYIARAWDDAIDDKLVDAKREDDYSFEVKEVPPKLYALPHYQVYERKNSDHRRARNCVE